MSYPRVVNLIKSDSNDQCLKNEIPTTFDKLKQLVQNEFNLKKQTFIIFQKQEWSENSEDFQINNDSDYQTALDFCQNLFLEKIDLLLKIDYSQNAQIANQVIQKQPYQTPQQYTQNQKLDFIQGTQINQDLSQNQNTQYDQQIIQTPNQQVSQSLHTCICGKKFDTKEIIPMILPCGHTLCCNCTTDQWKDRKIQCPIIENETHTTNPIFFEKNETLLNQLDFLENNKEQIQNQIEKIQNHQLVIYQLKKGINNKPSEFLQSMIKRTIEILKSIKFTVNDQFQEHEEENENKIKFLQRILNLEELTTDLTINQILQKTELGNVNQDVEYGKKLKINTQQFINNLQTDVLSILDQYQSQEVNNIFQQDQLEIQQESNESSPRINQIQENTLQQNAL